MSRRPVIRRKGEQGFALLLVFAMAAAIALILYKQMPRVAFESERDKEQLLIDRGGQYQRAIQVYYATFKRYPARIEDLENTNDKRFLRKRYIDPFTGKDEWRIVHTNGLFLTDSKVQKPPATPGTDGSNQLAGVGSPAGGTAPGGVASGGIGGTSSNTGTNGASSDPNTPPPVNAMVAARPSDRTLPGNQSYVNPAAPGITSQNFNQNLNQNPPNYNDPASFPPISLFPNGYNAPAQGQQGNGQPNGNQTGLNQGLNQGLGINQPGVNQLGLNPTGLNQPGLNQPGLNQPGLNQALNPLNLNQQGLPSGFPQPNPGQFNQGQPNAGLPAGIIGTPGIPNGLQQGTIQQGLAQQGLIPPQPGQQFQNQPFPGQQPSQGQPGQPIQLPGQPPPGQIPAGAPGAPGASPGLNMIQQLLTTPRAPPPGIGPATGDQNTGAAIAGVASKFTGASIKSYGGRTDYSEWEFVFQPQQQQVVPQMGQQQPNAQQGGQQTGQQQNGQQSGVPQQTGLGLGMGPGVGGPGGLPVPNH